MPQFLPIGSGTVSKLSLDPSTSSNSGQFNSGQPSTSLGLAHHPMLQLFPPEQHKLLRTFCNQHPSTIILRMTHRPNITLTTQDLNTLLTPGEQTHHELLLFGLEIATKAYQGSYLEPVFFPILQQQGWTEVMNWFSTSDIDCTRPLYNHPNLSIPIHIHGNHWVAVHRRITSGKALFFYADDLNNANTESIVKEWLFQRAPPMFCPTGSDWVSCQNTTYRPHSNECGPRTLLALTVMMSHSNPHFQMLLPYMSPNLALVSRVWMSTCLISGTAPLLPDDLVRYPLVNCSLSTISNSTSQSHSSSSKPLPCNAGLPKPKSLQRYIPRTETSHDLGKQPVSFIYIPRLRSCNGR
jgi:hypothetical protein